jgi:hypothetical protein
LRWQKHAVASPQDSPKDLPQDSPKDSPKERCQSTQRCAGRIGPRAACMSAVNFSEVFMSEVFSFAQNKA